MSRRYRDRWGVAHDACDSGVGGTHIVLCERASGAEWYDSRELMPAVPPTTCLLCLGAPEWLRRMMAP